MEKDRFTSLDSYRLLGKSGLRVSPLCLGTMTFGTEMGWGADKEESRRVFDTYVDRGGNFIDTANGYTKGTSETFLGEFMKGRRDRLVVATKYTMNMYPGDPNGGGNHRKNMKQSLEASLKRLQTDYIDLYWVHIWEFRTPIEEVMRALDDFVRQGKILYTGISDAPAWKIAQANTMAELRGWTPFITTQIHYNLIERTPERDIIPMALEYDMTVLPWSPLAGGVLTGKYGKKDLEAQEANLEEAKEMRRGDKRDLKLFDMLNEKSLHIAEQVKKVAEETGKTPSQVSLNWLLQKPAVGSIIIGARTEKQLEDNMGCLNFALDETSMKHLDEMSKIDRGFPHNMLEAEFVKNVITGGTKIES